MTDILAPSEVAANAFLDHARELLAAHPVVGNEVIMHAMSLLLNNAAYPELIVGKMPVDTSWIEPPEPNDTFVCPHCDEPTNPVMVDWGTWDTEVHDDDIDFDAKTYSPWYDHEPTMETLYVKSSCCGKPVRIPEGWELS